LTEVQFVRWFSTNRLECLDKQAAAMLVVWSVIVPEADNMLQVRRQLCNYNKPHSFIVPEASVGNLVYYCTRGSQHAEGMPTGLQLHRVRKKMGPIMF